MKSVESVKLQANIWFASKKSQPCFVTIHLSRMQSLRSSPRMSGVSTGRQNLVAVRPVVARASTTNGSLAQV